MLTLSDINTTTNSRDGDMYSDLYKNVFGSRPRRVTFESIEEFDKDFTYLSQLDKQIREQHDRKSRNFAAFVERVESTMQLVQCSTREHAIEIIAEAEGITSKEFEFYGLEILENELNLKYGSIVKWLSE